ncbi:MAG: hypothetical protein ABS38_01910 [Acidovorax sp. SCN 68-22]|jgi:hypothetical protein|nr:MAG: hypothetical protein ABS38_01910 [Acidovorax sp. SCN 68-22]
MQLPPVDRSTSWRPQGADLYSTGASGAVPVRPPHAPNPVESMDRLGAGAIVKTPEKPSDPDQANRDWTEVAEKKEIEKPPEPPKEPLYKQMIEFIQSMWRASGSAIELAQDVNKTTLAERIAQQANNEPLTYSDPKVKRTSGL